MVKGLGKEVLSTQREGEQRTMMKAVICQKIALLSMGAVGSHNSQTTLSEIQGKSHTVVLLREATFTQE